MAKNNALPSWVKTNVTEELEKYKDSMSSGKAYTKEIILVENIPVTVRFFIPEAIIFYEYALPFTVKKKDGSTVEIYDKYTRPDNPDDDHIGKLLGKNASLVAALPCFQYPVYKKDEKTKENVLVSPADVKLCKLPQKGIKALNLFIDGAGGLIGKDFKIVKTGTKSTAQYNFIPMDLSEFNPSALGTSFDLLTKPLSKSLSENLNNFIWDLWSPLSGAELERVAMSYKNTGKPDRNYKMNSSQAKDEATTTSYSDDDLPPF